MGKKTEIAIAARIFSADGRHGIRKVWTLRPYAMLDDDGIWRLEHARPGRSISYDAMDSLQSDSPEELMLKAEAAGVEAFAVLDSTDVFCLSYDRDEVMPLADFLRRR